MGASILLQGWTTVQGATATNWFQPASDAADLLHYKDLLAFIDVADFSNVTLQLQTSPTRDENFFQNFDAGFAPASATVSVAKYAYNAAIPIPLARYVRWRASPTAAGAWYVNVRIWLAPNISGNARKMRPDHKQALQQHLKMHEENAKKMEEAASSD